MTKRAYPRSKWGGADVVVLAARTPNTGRLTCVIPVALGNRLRKARHRQQMDAGNVSDDEADDNASMFSYGQVPQHRYEVHHRHIFPLQTDFNFSLPFVLPSLRSFFDLPSCIGFASV